MTIEAKPQHTLHIKDLLGDPEANALRRADKALHIPITSKQRGNLHAWDVHIEVLDQQIADAGLTLKERWERTDRKLIQDRDQRIGWKAK